MKNTVREGDGMKAFTKREKRLLVLVILTLCFIWGNSMMPGSISGAISDLVSELLSHLLHLPLDTAAGHGTVRKLAHGTEYLILAAELTVLLRFWRIQPWSAVFLCGAGAALLDETIQLFAADRAGQIQDVWIDLGGFFAGVLICLAIRRHRMNKAEKREA